jgi:hypothetical protein
LGFLGFLAFPISFFVIDALWWRAADRRLQGLIHARLWRALLGVFMTTMMLYVLVILVGPRSFRGSQGPEPQVVHIIAYLWHFMGLPLGVAMMIVPALRGAARAAVTRMSDRTDPPVIDDARADRSRRAAMPSRRQIMAAGAIAIPPLAVCAASLGVTKTLYGRRLRSFDLCIPLLPPQLEGMRIAHVSDTHIGKFLHPSRLPAIADDINRLDADFVVFTGDLIDFSLEDLPAGINFLRSLKSRCGLAICEGNHDLMDDRGDFENQLRDQDLPLIIGGQLTLPYVSPSGQSFPVQFLGTPWNFTDEFMNDAVDVVAPLIQPDAFPILLAHHPHHFDAASLASIPLVLSGHTHGGQIMLNDHFGAGSLRFRYISGLYQRNASSLIVNNGIGNWFPLRVNAPAEIVHITLHGLGRPQLLK